MYAIGHSGLCIYMCVIVVPYKIMCVCVCVSLSLFWCVVFCFQDSEDFEDRVLLISFLACNWLTQLNCGFPLFQGHFAYPDPSEWTDKELGIPPDEEDWWKDCSVVCTLESMCWNESDISQRHFFYAVELNVCLCCSVLVKIVGHYN